MKKLGLILLFSFMLPGLNAQQVQLLQSEPGGDPVAAPADDSGMPQVLMPAEDAPAPGPKIVQPVPPVKPAAKAAAKPAAKKAAAKPASAAAQSGTATVKTSSFFKQTVKLPPAAATAIVTATVTTAVLVTPEASAGGPKPALTAPVSTAAPAGVSRLKLASQPKSPAPAKKAPAAKPAVVKTSEPVKVTAVLIPVSAPAASKNGFVVGKTHTVSGGETLWELSGKYYKDPYKWGKIYNANLETVANPDRIYPKEELIIPDITEVIKPEPDNSAQLGSADIPKPSSVDADQAARISAPAPAASAARPVLSATAAALKDFESSDLSEEMPEHQKEWSANIKVVSEDWQQDGVIVAKEKGDSDSMADSFSMSGEVVIITMSGQGLAKKGDYLAIYLKGAGVFDKSGGRTGRELQSAGLAEVISVDGSSVKARVLDALTPIAAGYVVKRK